MAISSDEVTILIPLGRTHIEVRMCLGAISFSKQSKNLQAMGVGQLRKTIRWQGNLPKMMRK
jgi:hypothetical protein